MGRLIRLRQAFEAPLLSECNSNSLGRDIAKDIGHVRVQYGVTENGIGSPDADIKKKLAFANPAVVEHPQNNSRFNV